MYVKKKGFTLIELLVVIAIIGILASIISVSLLSSRAKGRDAKRVADLKSLQLALETYYNDNQVYPRTLGPLKPGYLTILPSDPNATTACSTGTEPSCYPYNSFDTTGSANCGNVSANPVVRYHLAAILETDDVKSVSLFLQDADWSPAAPYTECSGDTSATYIGFKGQSVACTSAAASPDQCYDLVN